MPPAIPILGEQSRLLHLWNRRAKLLPPARTLPLHSQLSNLTDGRKTAVLAEQNNPWRDPHRQAESYSDLQKRPLPRAEVEKVPLTLRFAVPCSQGGRTSLLRSRGSLF